MFDHSAMTVFARSDGDRVTIRNRKGHEERRAVRAVVTIARGDGAAVRLDEMSGDRQPEAETALRPRARGVRLAEALEDVGQEVRGDAGPGIVDRDLDGSVPASEASPDSSA